MSTTHRKEPGSSVQALQLGPCEHGSRGVAPAGEDLVDVGGASQGVVVHQEGHAIKTTTTTASQDQLRERFRFNINCGPAAPSFSS